jgi:ABC-type branched-subunit amino acid transport system substrate-binding protein
MSKVALCAIAKNENLYIREWVNWYKKLGVSKIFLYDNNDIDGEHFEDVISDYIILGLLRLLMCVVSRKEKYTTKMVLTCSLNVMLIVIKPN